MSKVKFFLDFFYERAEVIYAEKRNKFERGFSKKINKNAAEMRKGAHIHYKMVKEVLRPESVNKEDFSSWELQNYIRTSIRGFYLQNH